MRQKLADRRQQAEKQGLRDATELLTKLEDATKELAAEPRRDKALVKLNDLARQLRERRQELGGAENIKQQLESLKSLERGPADKLAQALARGDFKKAAEEIEKLKQELAKTSSGKPAQEALAKQLDAIQQKLDQMAEAKRAAASDLKQRAEQLRQDGRADEAGKLEDQISKLLEHAPQMSRMQQLAKKLGQCSKSLREGKGDRAAQSLEEAAGDLDRLQRQLDEIQTLDEAAQQLDLARQRMACPQCGGTGCELCQGGGGDGDGKLGDKPGNSLGAGRGIGPRPEQKTGTSFYDSQVRQKVGKGSGLVTDLVDGPNVRGKVEAEIQKESDAVRHGSTDPLSGQHIPKKHSEHAREYFDRFREGK